MFLLLPCQMGLLLFKCLFLQCPAGFHDSDHSNLQQRRTNHKRALPVGLCTKRPRSNGWEVCNRLLVFCTLPHEVWLSALMDFLPLSLYSSSTQTHHAIQFLSLSLSLQWKAITSHTIALLHDDRGKREG